ncbi:unnamed protein product [Heligmosomoides polygyrus]|uniref:Histidine acid phosphatase family protein n=1 Tax=Heligmosomoides polygyrus TaxID=6339 RepID=A0A183FNB4_HELPZ|nr:unnamed protein product [Heligmosomoides polygyrus]
MYGQNYSTSIPDEDYPSGDGWPVGFIPVAVHTVDDDTDYVNFGYIKIDESACAPVLSIGNPDADCDRQTKLWDMAKSSPELQAFQNRPDVRRLYLKQFICVVALLGNLTKNCGEKIDIDNLWVVRDSLLIEQIHANDSLRASNSWFTDDLFDQITTINDQVQVYQNGIFNGTLMMNSLDVGLELQKIRGGSLFNDINMHMNIKLDCRNKTTAGCKWINALKYYAYSAHDTTIYALFSIMHIQNAVIRPSGYPDYSAATFIELWLNHSDNKPYFKVSVGLDLLKT